MAVVFFWKSLNMLGRQITVLLAMFSIRGNWTGFSLSLPLGQGLAWCVVGLVKVMI